MNTELFIARRIIGKKDSKGNISRPIVNIAVAAIAIGLCVMIMSVSIVTGFKKEIRKKVVGFGSHIQIVNHDSNFSFETIPISKKQGFIDDVQRLESVKHIQVYATKAGIIKSGDQNQGIVLKGIGPDFDWSFFKANLIEGDHFELTDTGLCNSVLISKYISSLLQLEVDSTLKVFFIDEKGRLRGRPLTVSGIYDTGYEEFDKTFALVDIKHIQKLNAWNEDLISGFEIMLHNYSFLEETTIEIRNMVAYTYNEDGGKLKVENIREKYSQEFGWLDLQDINVWVILIIMTIVAGINMISSILILILERTNMIGILKSLGTQNWSVRKIFLYNAAFLIGKGLFWGNLIGIGLSLLQLYFNIVPLDPATYYIDTVPINFNILHILLLNAGTFMVIVAMLIIPSVIITKISPVDAIRFN